MREIFFIGVPFQLSLFVLVFRSSLDALVRHRPHHRLCFAVTSSKSLASSPEAFVHAFTCSPKSAVCLLFRHLSARFWPLSRRIGSSPPLLLASSRRHESNEPSLTARSLPTRCHTPPADRLQTSSSLSPEHTAVVGSVFPFHRPDLDTLINSI
ncbi:hypothetical protein PIB30_023282 [Stylosanthes scabra]|uniref:Secreted protein n=1 Tax=Stylosanthes scabra TaxID=79078 RepID=A0ABU6Z6W3_9FABA|nr:hypothetical protein [Stylosanthes scabra]